MLRTSHYTIYVDLPERPDEVLLIHGYSGAFDRVSRPVAGFLRSLSGKRTDGNGSQAGNGTGRKKGAPRPFRPSKSTREVLGRRGYLTDKTPEQEVAVVEKLVKTLVARDLHNQPGYVFMPTYNCNLRCPYCFQAHMRRDADSPLLRTMQPEMVDRIFAAMPGIEERHGMQPGAPQRPSILFFGGEPLLAVSRPIIDYIFAKGRERGITSYSAISNATELEAYDDLLGPEGISSLQITLDGPPAEHDQRRVYADGSGSFEKIAGNIDRALERGVRISVRMNVDHNNLAMVPVLAAEMAARGWPSKPGFSSYVAPIHAGNDQTDESSTMDSWVLKKSLRALVREHPETKVIGHADDSLRGRLRQVFHQRNDPMPSYRAGFCAAQNTMYIFDAFGDVYACWEHTGDSRIRVGHITAEGELESEAEEQERGDQWRGRNVLSNPQCRRCRFAFYCGGGCGNLAWSHSGEIHSSFCDGFARRFRSAAALAYGDFLRGEGAPVIQDAACDR